MLYIMVLIIWDSFLIIKILLKVTSLWKNFNKTIVKIM